MSKKRRKQPNVAAKTQAMNWAICAQTSHRYPPRRPGLAGVFGRRCTRCNARLS